MVNLIYKKDEAAGAVTAPLPSFELSAIGRQTSWISGGMSSLISVGYQLRALSNFFKWSRWAKMHSTHAERELGECKLDLDWARLSWNKFYNIIVL